MSEKSIQDYRQKKIDRLNFLAAGAMYRNGPMNVEEEDAEAALNRLQQEVSRLLEWLLTGTTPISLWRPHADQFRRLKRNALRSG